MEIQQTQQTLSLQYQSKFFLSNIRESAANPPSLSDKPIIKKGLVVTRDL